MYDTQLVKLNNLLKSTDKFVEVNKIEEAILKIQAKEI